MMQQQVNMQQGMSPQQLQQMQANNQLNAQVVNLPPHMREQLFQRQNQLQAQAQNAQLQQQMAMQHSQSIVSTCQYNVLSSPSRAA